MVYIAQLTLHSGDHPGPPQICALWLMAPPHPPRSLPALLSPRPPSHFSMVHSSGYTRLCKKYHLFLSKAFPELCKKEIVSFSPKLFTLRLEECWGNSFIHRSIQALIWALGGLGSLGNKDSLLL